ncbi:MAG: hypothetical protein C0478_09835 [Planctomyces sp.]|jgi:flagellar biosynthetic protein FliR|nr:hypothetical protein [Planctomyces sp.]
MLSSLLLNAALLEAVAQFQVFLLVLVRLSGLALTGPLFGSTSVPMNVRVLLIFVLALLVTPTIGTQAGQGFALRDINHDQQLSGEEISPALAARFEQNTPSTGGEPSPVNLTRGEYTAVPAPPQSLLELVMLLLGELVIGLFIGLGIQIVMSGLQMAGQIIDQQGGFGLGEVFNPDLKMNASQSGQLLFWLGTVIFLVLEPIGGHLMMLRTLVESFQSIPVGRAFWEPASIELLNQLMQSSFSLAIRFAAPIMLVMCLVDAAIGFLSHTVPQINIQAVGFSLKAMVSLLLLVTLFSGPATIVSNTLNETLQTIRQGLELPTSSEPPLMGS